MTFSKSSQRYGGQICAPTLCHPVECRPLPAAPAPFPFCPLAIPMPPSYYSKKPVHSHLGTFVYVVPSAWDSSFHTLLILGVSPNLISLLQRPHTVSVFTQPSARTSPSPSDFLGYYLHIFGQQVLVHYTFNFNSIIMMVGCFSSCSRGKVPLSVRIPFPCFSTETVPKPQRALINICGMKINE